MDWRACTRSETCSIIKEFITLTPRSKRALLGLLRRHEMQVRKFAWKAPEDDGLWSQFYSNEIETTIGTNMQGRVVDAASALAAWKPDPDLTGALTLRIDDAFAPWNSGTWKIAFEYGNVTVSSTHEDPQVFVDIQAFSEAFFGALTPASLRHRDRLQVHDEAGFHALCHLLAGPPMWAQGFY